MKKVKKEQPQHSHDGKGFLELAGKAVAVLGEEIVEGKDKIVEVASEKFTAVKKAIKKFRKKKATPARSAKKPPVKKAVKKAVKKVAKKVAKKTPKKAAKSKSAKPKKSAPGKRRR
jgi:hypothetical protein